jgi:hypothetical protein
MKFFLAGAAFLAALIALSSCEHLNTENARTVLTTLCRLKQSDLFTVWITDAQRQAGAVVCAAIGLPEGT